MSQQTKTYLLSIFNECAALAPIEPLAVYRLFGSESAQLLATWWQRRRI